MKLLLSFIILLIISLLIVGIVILVKKNKDETFTPCNDSITSSPVKKVLELARTGSEMAYLVYNDAVDDFSYAVTESCPKLKLNLDAYGKEGDQEWLTMSDKKYGVICISGSLGVTDWIVNFSILPTIDKYDSKRNKYQIHRGFYNSAISVYDVVQKWIATYKSQGKTVILTGHSKGGAVAQVLYFLYKLNGTKMPNYLVTFASPKVFKGNNIVNYMSRHCGNVVHVETEFDPVPTLPPALPLGEEWSLTCPSRILDVDTYSIPTAHGLNQYAYGLNNKFGCKKDICGCPDLTDVPFFPGGSSAPINPNVIPQC